MPGGECAAVEGFKAKHGPGAPSNAKPVTFIEYVDVDEHTYTEEGPVEIQLDRQGSFLHYFPSFLDHGTLRSLREELEASLNAARERTHAFGLDAFTSEGGHHQWFAWGSDWRANTRWRRQAWPLETESELAPIVAIKAAVDDQVQTVVQGVSPFNSVLVNRYANGKAHIKWHADDECCYGDAHNSTIGSVSFGAPRLFCLRRKAHWQHSLPPDETCGDVPRINLTFRHVFFDKTMKHHHASKTLALLEEKSLLVLKDALCNHTRVAFFNTLNVGDCVLMHMLWRLRCEGASAGGAQVSTGCNCETVVVDSGHLFADTLPFLADMEALYAFKAHLVSRAPGVSRAEVAAATGALSPPMQDSLHYCEEYWLEPLRRAIHELETQVLITARRRDQSGAHRHVSLADSASLYCFKDAPVSSLNPLAHWHFEDLLCYAAKHSLPLHPSLAQGFPSHADMYTTAPVPADASVRYVNHSFVGAREEWLSFGGEHKGRTFPLV